MELPSNPIADNPREEQNTKKIGATRTTFWGRAVMEGWSQARVLKETAGLSTLHNGVHFETRF